MAAADQKLYQSVLDALLKSPEPSVRWKVRVGVLHDDPDAPDMRSLQEDVRNSARVKTLLARRDKNGRLVSGRSVYDKGPGAHRILATLADLGYPEGDNTLVPVR